MKGLPSIERRGKINFSFIKDQTTDEILRKEMRFVIHQLSERLIFQRKSFSSINSISFCKFNGLL